MRSEHIQKIEFELAQKLIANGWGTTEGWSESNLPDLSHACVVGELAASVLRFVESMEPFRKGWLIRIHSKRSGITGETFAIALARTWLVIFNDSRNEGQPV